MEKTWFWMGIAVVKAEQESKFAVIYSKQHHAGAPNPAQWVPILTDGLLRRQRIVSSEGKAIHVAGRILEIAGQLGLGMDKPALVRAINAGNYRILDKMRAGLWDQGVEEGRAKEK